MACHPGRRLIGAVALLSFLFVLFAPSSNADTPAQDMVSGLVDRECLNLNREKLLSLVIARFSAEMEEGPSPELLKIMEGVIKRTDFDGIAEEKTVEIIGLVYGAFKKGAPLEFLDEIFDVAYVKTITVDQLYAAAVSLKEFHGSDVPQDIYEEFVYHSIEDGWDPASVPVFSRGLIYGVERGLSPKKIALIIMMDAQNPVYAGRKPEQIVMESIKLVREKEPRNWKPMSEVEKDLARKMEKQRSLEQRKSELDNAIDQKERAFVQARSELKELREYPAGQGQDVDMDKLNRDLERLLKNLQGEIAKYQDQRGGIVAELEATKKAVDRQQAIKDRERRGKRERELSQTQERITAAGRSGRLNEGRLVSAVERLIGTPYRFGGDSEQGIDCSAFTRRVYRSQNVELPRSSREQARVGSSVAYASVTTGDLIFFDTSINGGISHVGVSLGNGAFAHASSSRGVTRSSIKEKYYVKRFVKGGRIFVD